MPDLETLIGARGALREQARLVLQLLDQLDEAQIRETGWQTIEIAILERLAAMRIEGIPFGKWPID